MVAQLLLEEQAVLVAVAVLVDQYSVADQLL
jgi:hypothetical protein